MQTKNIVIIGSLTIVSLVLGLFWVVAPALMKDKVVGVITFASTGRQCFNYYKNEKDYFKDPDSAYIESSRILTKKDDKEELSQYPVVLEDDKYDSVVQIKVRARNSMGGYVSDNIYCPLSSGKFDEIQQSLYFTEVNLKEEWREICAKAVAIGMHTASIDEHCSNR